MDLKRESLSRVCAGAMMLLLALVIVPGVQAADAPPASQPTVNSTNDGVAASISVPADKVQPPTEIDQELGQIRPGVYLKKEFDRIAGESNIRFGLANTFLFQQATDGPGNKTAAGGDIDFLAKWTAIGAGTPDTGVVAFAAEYRFQMGDQPPSELGGEIGTLLSTTNGFSERPVVVKELYWDQRLFDDRFRYAVGRIDPENLFGGHRLQSANNFFLNKAFSTNPTISYPGPSFGVAAGFKPTTWSFIHAGLADANGKVTTVGVDTFFTDTEYLSFVEAGFTPKFDGLGSGRYRFAFWHLDARQDAGTPSDRGFTMSFDQELGKQFIAFFRYGYSDADVTGIRNSVQGGVGIIDVLGKQNLFGVAAGWSQPVSSDKREETVLEVFQRFQVTETTQLTFDAEMIFNPGDNTEDDFIAVFSARLRIAI